LRLLSLSLGSLLLAFVWIGQAQAQDTTSCSDFSNIEEAQRFYDDHADDNPNNPDPFNIDTDKDGNACEGLPPASSASPGATTAPSTTSAEQNFVVTYTVNGGAQQTTTVQAANAEAARSEFAQTNPTATIVSVQPQSLQATGAETGVLALSGLSLLEAGYGLTLASKRLGIRRRAIPLYLMRKMINAAETGSDRVEISDDVYLVHRSVLESYRPDAGPDVSADEEPVEDDDELFMPEPVEHYASPVVASPSVYAAIARPDALPKRDA
jgi:hypothetical protein